LKPSIQAWLSSIMVAIRTF